MVPVRIPRSGSGRFGYRGSVRFRRVPEGSGADAGVG